MKLDWNKNPDDSLKLFTIEQFMKQEPALYKKTILYQDDDTIRFCRIIDFQNVISGTFLVPVKQHPIESHNAFAFCLYNNTLFFIGEPEKTKKLIDQFMSRYDTIYHSPLMFLVGLMLFMIHDDVYYLESYNIQLEEIEEKLFANNHVGMGEFTMTTRRDMEILSSYYLQLSVAAETLQKLIDEFDDDSPQIHSLLTLYETKVNQLHGMVVTIKNYTSQIWNLRQTQLSDRQNKITTVLTIITTIFLPLTLITGWFGMNFQNLPLIYSTYGYTIIFALCVIIIAIELIFIWSRHLFK